MQCCELLAGRSQSRESVRNRSVDYPLRGERTAIPMISRDDRIPLLRLISATLDSDSSSILRLQPRYMLLRLAFKSSLES